MLTFPSGTQLDLTVSWQQVIGGRSYFVLQPYLGSVADLNPVYELIRRSGAVEVFAEPHKGTREGHPITRKAQRRRLEAPDSKLAPATEVAVRPRDVTRTA